MAQEDEVNELLLVNGLGNGQSNLWVPQRRMAAAACLLRHVEEQLAQMRTRAGQHLYRVLAPQVSDARQGYLGDQVDVSVSQCVCQCLSVGKVSENNAIDPRCSHPVCAVGLQSDSLAGGVIL